MGDLTGYVVGQLGQLSGHIGEDLSGNDKAHLFIHNWKGMDDSDHKSTSKHEAGILTRLDIYFKSVQQLSLGIFQDIC